MNQILSVQMPNDRKKSSGKKANVKSIIIFFCIILVIFGILVAVMGIKSLLKKGEQEPQNTVITGSQPSIDIERLDDSKLNIIVTHDKEISSVSYHWNDEDAVEQVNIGQANYELEIDIPSGTNTLNISVTDINGVTQTYSQEYSGSNIFLEQIPNENKIKATVEGEKTIAYISYSWGNGEPQRIEVNDIKTEQYIDIIEGQHTLNVQVEYQDGTTTSRKIEIKTNLLPEVTIKTDNVNFIISASDEEGLSKMTINLNGNDLDEITINNEKQYETSVPLQEGINRIIVTVYDINNSSAEKRVQWDKK